MPEQRIITDTIPADLAHQDIDHAAIAAEDTERRVPHLSPSETDTILGSEQTEDQKNPQPGGAVTLTGPQAVGVEPVADNPTDKKVPAKD